MSKYLITGFSGFVGRNFVEYLENNEKNCLVKGVDIHNPSRIGSLYSKRLRELNLI